MPSPYAVQKECNVPSDVLTYQSKLLFSLLSWEKYKTQIPKNTIQIFSQLQHAPIFFYQIERRENRAAREIDAEIESRISLADPKKEQDGSISNLGVPKQSNILVSVARGTQRSLKYSSAFRRPGATGFKENLNKKRFQLLLCCAVTSVWAEGGGAEKIPKPKLLCPKKTYIF